MAGSGRGATAAACQKQTYLASEMHHGDDNGARAPPKVKYIRAVALAPAEAMGASLRPPWRKRGEFHPVPSLALRCVEGFVGPLEPM